MSNCSNSNVELSSIVINIVLTDSAFLYGLACFSGIYYIFLLLFIFCCCCYSCFCFYSYLFRRCFSLVAVFLFKVVFVSFVCVVTVSFSLLIMVLVMLLMKVLFSLDLCSYCVVKLLEKKMF